MIADEASHATETGRRYRPRWLVVVPVLGRPPALTRRQWHVLGLVAAATFFDQYDVALFGLALKQIQLGLGIGEAALGGLGSIVRMGALGAFPLLLAADRLGRRRALLVTVVGYTLFTGATAFSPDARTFVAFQLLARLFIAAETLLAFVVIAEELDADRRGWGVGAVNALAIVGQGLALGLFALVDVLPLGWRSLYLVGLVPLTLLAYFRRSLPETERFAQLHAKTTASSTPRAFAPVLALLRAYPRRAAAVGALFFFEALSSHSVGFFSAKYVQDVHGWRPWQFAALGFAGGVILLAANVATGRLSDRWSRRRVAVVALGVYPVTVLAFFAASGWLVGAAWIAMSFFGIACDVVLYTLAAELFPTSHRATASGAWLVLRTLGSALGLGSEGLLYLSLGSHRAAISLLALAGFACPFIAAFCLPETSRRSLEEIAPER